MFQDKQVCANLWPRLRSVQTRIPALFLPAGIQILPAMAQGLFSDAVVVQAALVEKSTVFPGRRNLHEMNPSRVCRLRVMVPCSSRARTRPWGSGLGHRDLDSLDNWRLKTVKGCRRSTVGLRTVNMASQKVSLRLLAMLSGNPGRLCAKISWAPARGPFNQCRTIRLR